MGLQSNERMARFQVRLLLLYIAFVALCCTILFGAKLSGKATSLHSLSSLNPTTFLQLNTLRLVVGSTPDHSSYNTQVIVLNKTEQALLGISESIDYDSLKMQPRTVKRTAGLNMTLGPPLSKPKNCRQKHCTEILSFKEKISLKFCLRTVAKQTGILYANQLQATLKENDCSFMNGKDRLPVALISSEGSGNTWVRGLLETASGICTGFIYCDYVMRMKGFVGENIKSGSVIVVKTHTSIPQWYGEEYKRPKRDKPYYGAAVFVVRNPFDSLLAEWNRRVTNTYLIPKHLPHNESHTNIVPKEYWSIPEWDNFLYTYMDQWRTRIVNWVLLSGDHPVHVVRYEDLKRDVSREVANILLFLNIPFNEQELPQRLKNDFAVFRRKHNHQIDFEHFSETQREYIKTIISDTVRLVREHNKTHQIELEDYLNHR